jgi:hypothetical protein
MQVELDDMKVAVRVLQIQSQQSEQHQCRLVAQLRQNQLQNKHALEELQSKQQKQQQQQKQQERWF